MSVEKVSGLILVTLLYSRYKQARVPDAAVSSLEARRPAAHDGKPFPLGVAVLLLRLEDQVPEIICYA